MRESVEDATMAAIRKGYTRICVVVIHRGKGG